MLQKASTSQVTRVARIAAVTAILETMGLLDQVGKRDITIRAMDTTIAKEHMGKVMQGKEVQMHMRRYRR